MENHSVIDYDILIKRDNSYGYAVANPANKISAKQLAKKAVDLAGVQISPVIAEAIIASAMQVATNFGDLTTHASLHFTGKASFIKDGSSQDNGGNNGGNNPDDGMLG